MPELPEVETVRRGLQRQTPGFRIEKVVVRRARAVASPADPGDFTAALEGSWVGDWRRRGKYLIASLRNHRGDAGHWGVHLRMTGQFLWLESPRQPCPHTRVQLWNPEGQELRFIDTRSFGQMWWVPPGEPLERVITGLRRLGPEPLEGEFSLSYFKGRLEGSTRAIKSALLDQSVVAGVGNIYADESLFAAGIRPSTPSGRLSSTRLEALRQSLVEVLEASIGAGGTTFSDFRDLTGTNGNYGGEALVYRRSGQSCRRCGGTILREKLAGRSTHWCPGCQH